MSTVKQKGFTLIEILIGLGLGLFLLGNGLLIYSVLVKSFYDLVAGNRLEQQLRVSMNVMVQDIMRAGYWASAKNDLKTGANTNPFMAAGVDITVPSSTCILFAYDSDSSGLIPTLNATNYDERFGYRLSGTTLQTRALTDSTFNCGSGSWQDLTDPNLVRISGLTFVLTPTVITISGTSTLTIRNVTVTLTGSLTKDAAITRTVSQTIRVRNDKYTP